MAKKFVKMFVNLKGSVLALPSFLFEYFAQLFCRFRYVVLI